MKKFKIVGGVIGGIIGLNLAIMWYLGIPRHVDAVVAEEEANPDQPRKSIHQLLNLAFANAFDEKFGPV